MNYEQETTLLTDDNIASLKNKLSSRTDEDEESDRKRTRLSENYLMNGAIVDESPSSASSSTLSDHHITNVKTITAERSVNIESSSSSASSTSSSSNNESVVASSSTITTTTTTTTNTTITTTSSSNLTHVFMTSDMNSPRQLLQTMVPQADLNRLPPDLDDFDVCRILYYIMSSRRGDTDSDSDDQEQANDLFNALIGEGSSSDSLRLDLPDSLAALNHASALSSLFLVPRDKLFHINTIEHCVDLIASSRNIVVLTGAGCSVSCGIPDFRSRDGIYARLRVDFPDLPDPQAMFDIEYFKHDPRPFFKFAKEIYPGQFKPSLSHMFVKQLEENGKLLRNYTQNIDTLEQVAGIHNVIQCHGSFNTATCTRCRYQVSSEHIRERIFQQEIPYCEKCEFNIRAAEQDNAEASSTPGILKPDIVFFGEGLPELYHKSINQDKNKCDLLIVIGSSLKVKPVANIPHMLPKSVPQILINRESLKHMNFDVELLGDCDVIVQELLLRLGHKETGEAESGSNWSRICTSGKKMLHQIENQEAERMIFEKTERPIVIHHRNESDDEDYDEDDEEDTGHQDLEQENASKPEREEKEATDPVDNNGGNYTRDYLKENSFIYLKPSIYIFHGAELSLRHARRKLKRLRRKYNAYMRSVNGEQIEEINEDDEGDEFGQRGQQDEEGGGENASNGRTSYLSQLYKEGNEEDDDESDESFDTSEDDDDDDDDDDFTSSEEDELDEPSQTTPRPEEPN